MRLKEGSLNCGEAKVGTALSADWMRPSRCVESMREGAEKSNSRKGQESMENDSIFAQVEPGLGRVLDELRTLEPIFHRKEFGLTAEERERRVAPEYWEVGASGRRYSRDFIMKTLAEKPPVDAEEAGWSWRDFGLRQLGPGTTYLCTYTLDQAGRITRRATVWHKSGEGWRILYHQGTVVTGADATLPE